MKYINLPLQLLANLKSFQGKWNFHNFKTKRFYKICWVCRKFYSLTNVCSILPMLFERYVWLFKVCLPLTFFFWNDLLVLKLSFSVKFFLAIDTWCYRVRTVQMYCQPIDIHKTSTVTELEVRVKYLSNRCGRP